LVLESNLVLILMLLLLGLGAIGLCRNKHAGQFHGFFLFIIKLFYVYDVETIFTGSSDQTQQPRVPSTHYFGRYELTYRKVPVL
jgi:uncharacterized membrane protein